jgi:protein RecA
MGRLKGGKNKAKITLEIVKKQEKFESNPDNKKEEIDITINPGQEHRDMESLGKVEVPINPELKKIVNELGKTFGHEVIHLASEEVEKERIPTGIEAFDKLTGGLPAGAFTVIWGNKGSTKTTTALHLIAEAQKIGKTCLYLDLEHSYDNEWATKCGVDTSKLLIASNFDNAEQAMDTAIKVSREKVVDVIVLDSVQALSPKGEQEEKSGKEKSVEDDTMALLARKLSLFFRVSGTDVYRGKVTFILIGQARTDLGGFIKLDKLSGGKALGHYATLVIKAYKAGKADAPHFNFRIGEKNKSFPIGSQICYRLEKKKISHTAPEETELRQDFYNEFGFKKPTDKEIETLYHEWIEFEQED